MRNAEKRSEYYKRWYHKRVWPKCKDCGWVSRHFDDFGCLNCYAKGQPWPRPEWTEKELDLIEIYAGKDDPKNLQFRLYTETGIPRTREALKLRVTQMGISTLDHQDAYTIPQLMEITGKSRNTFVRLIREGKIKSIGKGSRLLISIDDGDRLIEHYRVKDKPSYTVAEVMRLIGCTEDAVRQAYRLRGLPCWQEGGTKRICKATVDRAVMHLRETGAVRVPWRSLVGG